MKKLESLIGKNVIEVISVLPNFKYKFREDAIKEVKTKISTLFFVYYEKKKPREEVDLYRPIDTSNGITLEDLSFIRGDEKNCIGLMSKVELGRPYQNTEHKTAHIPLIDFDTDGNFDFLSDRDLLELLKREIKEKIELEQGLLLKSSNKRNYHFIGTNRLFSEQEFITFSGLCLAMKYKTEDGKSINLVDSRHVGHGLSPMKYISEIEKQYGKNWSRYDFIERFSTLRITPKIKEAQYPIVVDVLKWKFFRIS